MTEPQAPALAGSAATADAVDAADATDPAVLQAGRARLEHLFRASLREGRLQPLLRLLQAHRLQAPRVPVARPTPERTCSGLDGPVAVSSELVRQRVADLPALPEAAMRALQTLRRDDASMDEVADHLGCDASLAARVLRLANSPFYGVPGRVASIRGAAQVLGRRTLESVLTLAAVPGQFGAEAGSRQFVRAAFWRHALASAIVARALARAHGEDENMAFVAGLLHDIGLLAMSVYFPAELDTLMDCAHRADVEFSWVEQQQGLTPHAHIGCWIAEHWRFPPAVAQAIALHHTPLPQPRGRATMADCVHVANAVAHALDVAGLPHELVPAIDLAVWNRVAVPDAQFLQILAEAEAGVDALCSALPA